MSGQLQDPECLSPRAEPPLSIESEAVLAFKSIWALRIRDRAVPLPEIEARLEGRADRLSFSVFMTHTQQENKSEFLRKFRFC